MRHKVALVLAAVALLGVAPAPARAEGEAVFVCVRSDGVVRMGTARLNKTPVCNVSDSLESWPVTTA